MQLLQDDHFFDSTSSNAACIHVGHRRHEQQDCALIDDRFMIIADGMGGQPDGRAVSRLAVEGAAEWMGAHDGTFTFADMSAAFRAARRNAATLHDINSYGQMLWQIPATTLIIAARHEVGGLVIGHLGDSRAFVFANDKLKQVTSDHEDFSGGVMKAIGFGNDMPDVVRVESGRVILATDGLWCRPADIDIAEICRDLDAASDLDLSKVLVNAANAASGNDNVTIAVWTIKN